MRRRSSSAPTPPRPERDVRIFRALHPYDRDESIRLFLQKGWSLRLQCFDCGRIVEWTPPMLLDQFGGRLDVTLADLAPRATCRGDGCGSRRIMLHPVNYGAAGHAWSPPAGLGPSDA
ncbi:MAG TPA: hypothetical protein VHY34_13140 [Caulobacteraceae bacterium]|jgi:hypothetical protein|nr:hypothetical protein [Caulobacteraceae bacterium]